MEAPEGLRQFRPFRDTPERSTVQLFVVRGPGKGQHRPLSEEPISIGRDPSNDIVLEDHQVSRHHAVIQPMADGVWMLCDQESTNNTHLNGEAIVRAVIQEGDAITIGDSQISIQATAALGSPIEVQVDTESLQRSLSLDGATSTSGKPLTESLFQVGLLADPSLSPAEFLRRTLGIVSEGVPFETWAWLTWIEDPEGEPTIVGEKNGRPVSPRELDPSRSLVARARSQRAGLISSQLGDAFAQSVVLRREQAVTAMAIPLLARTGSDSVLYLERSASCPPFGADDLSWVATLASQIAVDLENTRLYSQLHQAFEELNRSRDQLTESEKMAAIGRLASGFAHDLNNPLGSILGFIDLANRSIQRSGNPVPEALGEYLAKAKDAADFCRALSRNLLAFARRRPFGESSHGAFSIEDTIESTLAVCDASIRQSGCQIEVNVPEGLSLSGDPSTLQQVVMNLVVNAADAIADSEQEGGTIVVTVSSASNGIDLVVSDNGPGMPREIADRIFEPLFTTKTESRGTGLGLFVVNRIIEEAGGSIEVETEPGSGTRFKLEIPDQLARLGSEEIDLLSIPTSWPSAGELGA